MDGVADVLVDFGVGLDVFAGEYLAFSFGCVRRGGAARFLFLFLFLFLILILILALTSSPTYSSNWAPSFLLSLMPSLKVAMSAGSDKYPPSMMGLTCVLEEANLTLPQLLARVATLWKEYPSGWFLVLRNCSERSDCEDLVRYCSQFVSIRVAALTWVKVVMPSGPMALAGRNRIWRSACASAPVLTKAPWSHPTEVSSPLPLVNHLRIGMGLLSLVPLILSLLVTLTPFFGVSKLQRA